MNLSEQLAEISYDSNKKQYCKMVEEMKENAKAGFYTATFVKSDEDEITNEMLETFKENGLTIEENYETDEITISWEHSKLKFK